MTFTTEDGSISERLEVSGDMPGAYFLYFRVICTSRYCICVCSLFSRVGVVGELKGLLEAIFMIPATQQVLVCEGQELGTSGTIASLGIKDNDLVLIVNTGNRSRGAAGSGGRGQVARVPRNGMGAMSGGSGGSGGREWDGMDIQDVFENNTNPEVISRIIRSRENLMKQLQFHNPELAAEMAKDEATALRALRGFMMMQATKGALARQKKGQEEREMRERLERDPNDQEAKMYFDKQSQEAMLEEHRRRTMEEFPESFVRVLMLYIEVEINGTALQAFVDSGAQTSVISARCAERCGLTPYIDGRFAGKVVGVGNGRTLGRVLYTNMTIEGNYFPISLTVMDDSQGLGDKNMEFLLGLDMLKRHQCTIDLVNGRLLFNYQGQQKSTPFLHEKDLPKTKGGTKDFDPNHQEKDN